MEEKNYLLKTKERLDHRLKKNSQFNYLFRNGERKSSKHFTLFYCNSRFNCYKIGYSISKKIGKAWKRNLLRRRLKEIVRKNDLLTPKRNYVLKAREGAGELDYKQIEKEILDIFRKGKDLNEKTM